MFIFSTLKEWPKAAASCLNATESVGCWSACSGKDVEKCRWCENTRVCPSPRCQSRFDFTFVSSGLSRSDPSAPLPLLHNEYHEVRGHISDTSAQRGGGG